MNPRQRNTRRIVLVAMAAAAISVLSTMLGALGKFAGWPTETLGNTVWCVGVPVSLSLSTWATIRSYADTRRAIQRLRQSRAYWALPVERPEQRRPREMETEAMLLSLLNERDADRYRRGLAITVTGSAGGKYLIRPGFSSNVTRLSPVRANLCAQPVFGAEVQLPEVRVSYEVAKHVSVAAQLLMIQTDEPVYLSIAREYQND